MCSCRTRVYSIAYTPVFARTSAVLCTGQTRLSIYFVAPKQPPLTALVHKNAQNKFMAGSQRLQLFRVSMSLPETTAWTVCRSTNAIGTYMPNRQFRAWLQFYSQVPLFQPGPRCLRKRCTPSVDVFVDHLLTVTSSRTEFGAMMRKSNSWLGASRKPHGIR